MVQKYELRTIVVHLDVPMGLGFLAYSLLKVIYAELNLLSNLLLKKELNTVRKDFFMKRIKAISLLLITCFAQVEAVANEPSLAETLSAVGLKMATLLTEAPADKSPRTMACGNVGMAAAQNYLANISEPVARTKTTCQLYQDLSVEVKKFIPVFSSLTVTAVGESALQRFVDETCAVPASTVPVNQDNGERLRGAVALILVSPVGPLIANILTTQGIAHEANPERLQQQVESWTRNPGNAFVRSDPGKGFCAATFHIGC